MRTALVLHTPVISLRLYGSCCRGDSDELSDVDVLAVYEKTPTDKVRDAVHCQVKGMFNRKVDLAEYSAPRMREFFARGHLFAWHLFSESESLTSERDSFFEELGAPAPYKEARTDAGSFLELVRSGSREVYCKGASVIYEAGLAYLASRNVAICVSYALNGQPDFSRYAIYRVCQRLGVAIGVDRGDYERLIQCRFASIRGQVASDYSAEWFVGVSQLLELACEAVVEKTFGEHQYGKLD